MGWERQPPAAATCKGFGERREIPTAALLPASCVFVQFIISSSASGFPSVKWIIIPTSPLMVRGKRGNKGKKALGISKFKQYDFLSPPSTIF